MKLYFSRNPNPRLAVSVARFLKAEVAFEFAEPMAPGQAERYRALNPNLLLPILERPGRPLWETDAIACYLSRHTGSNFWRRDDDEPEMIRWVSWGKENFVRACDMVHWERGTKLRYGIGENLYGYEAISGFRAARSPVGLNRRTAKTVISSYGRDTAVASTLFYRNTAPGKVGRQMQTWIRFPEGWRVVAAHVSIIDEPKETA